MTWDDVLALDEEALNLALEQIAGRVWTQDTITPTGQRCWVHTKPDGFQTWSTVPHLYTTASWNATMDLAWQYGVDIDLPSRLEPASRGVAKWLDREGYYAKSLRATTPEGLRVAICRLALWGALQEEVTHADPA